jgi:urease beta subunit
MSVHFDHMPKKIMKALKEAAGVRFEPGHSGDVSVLDLTDSVEGTNIHAVVACQ